MAIIRTDITATYPELAAASNAQLDSAIARAYARLNVEVWDSFLDEGALYLASHMVAVSLPGFRGGVVTSEKLGPASKTYQVAQSAPGDEGMASTKYGREYIALRDILPGTHMVLTTAIWTDP